MAAHAPDWRRSSSATPRLRTPPTTRAGRGRRGREPLCVPCPPAGCLVLLKKAGAKLDGANAVVVGRSNIVGMPAALLLVKENATVTICHSRTKNLPEVCRRGDVLIAAIGEAEMIRGSWGRPRAD